MKLFIVILLALSPTLPAICQEQKTIDQIKNFHSGEYVIATDLYLGGDRINRVPVTSDELAEVIDFYFVTHDHGDHFGRETARVLAKNSACRFILPESCMETARNLNIPDDRITIARPREPFEMDGIKVQPLRALHGAENFAVYYDANLQDCGYLITINGIKILQPGDKLIIE